MFAASIDAGERWQSTLAREQVSSGVDDLKLNGPDQPLFPPPTAYLSRGALHLQGSQNADYIVVEINGNFVEVSVQHRYSLAVLYSDDFPAADVDELRIFGLAGDDVIENNTSIPDALWGGLGNDDLLGGDGPTIAFGQEGDDIIHGRDGDDFLYGESEQDYLFGGAGHDLVDGGDATDVISGGHGDGSSDDETDLLIGGADGDYFIPSDVELADDIYSDFDPMEDWFW